MTIITDEMRRKLAEALFRHEWERVSKPPPFDADQEYWMEAADAALDAIRSHISELREFRSGLGWGYEFMDGSRTITESRSLKHWGDEFQIEWKEIPRGGKL